MDDRVTKYRYRSLAVAETVDAWRVFPRIALALYIALVAYVIKWFISIETYTKTQCDATVLETILSKGISLSEAQAVACTVVEVVGGPQNSHTVIAATIAGLSTAIFGLYTNSGKDWSKQITPWTK